MKSYLPFILVFLMCISYADKTQAMNSGSELVIQFNQPGFYKAEIARESFDSRNGIIQVSGLRPGVHHIKIYRFVKHHPFDSGRWIFLGHDSIEIGRRVLVQTTWSDRRGFHQTVIADQRRGNSNRNSQAHWRGNSHREVFMMPAPVFDVLLARLNSASFESTRKEIAFHAISQHGISVSQLRVVLGYFNFESNRFEIAKSVHPYVYDPENYFMLSDAFIFESNARALLAMSHRR